jgi:hypothetical protein
MLKYVRELGWVFSKRMIEFAAGRGDLEALRYLHQCGVSWDIWTLAKSMQADSLPCLEYAHMHDCPQCSQGNWSQYDFRALSLTVLRCVCEHMDPEFAAKVLDWTAFHLSCKVGSRRRESQPWEEGLDWPLVLYLGRKLGAALPEALAEAKATLTKRAIAFAGVFRKAEKQLRAEKLLRARLRLWDSAFGKEDGIITPAIAQRWALWDAMARVPKELQERIAVEAELIML